MIRSVLKLFVVGVIVGIAAMATGSFFTVPTALATDSVSSLQVLVEEQATGFTFSVFQGKDVMAVRVEVLSLGGRKIYDSGWVAERVVAWPMVNSAGRPLANGVYLYAVSSRDRAGRTQRKLGKLSLGPRLEPSLSVPGIGGLVEVQPAAGLGNKFKEVTGTLDGVANWRLVHNGTILLFVQDNSSNPGGIGDLGVKGVLGVGTTNPSAQVHAVSRGKNRAGEFDIVNDSNSQPALFASTAGTGRAGEFDIFNGSNNDIALFASTDGKGTAVVFEILNSDNGNPVLEATTKGAGPAFFGFTSGLGKAAEFESTNPDDLEAALDVSSSGSASSLSSVAHGRGIAGEFRNDDSKNNIVALLVSTNGTGGAASFSGNSHTSATLQVSNLEGQAAHFLGNVDINGTLTKSSGSFKIDHPLDPANKYLYHSFVESPDMKNIYDGTVTLDAQGEAWVELPNWFEALNKDFRYQLTAIGAPGPNLYIAEEIKSNKFKIAGGKPGMEVSWQVTGIRKDPYANDHRIQVEEQKPEAERGYYLYPQGYGQPANKSIGCAQHTKSTPQCKQEQAVK